MKAYPGRYSDSHGSESTTVYNDGETLTMQVRGVVFRGRCFDDFTPDDVPPAGVTLNRGELCDCVIELTLPVPMVMHGTEEVGELSVRLTLGSPAANGGIDKEDLLLKLVVGDLIAQSSGEGGWFDAAMSELDLPHGVWFATCLSCQMSEYPPSGSGLFADLVCFRSVGTAVLQASSKRELLEIWGQNDGPVQEVGSCDAFVRWISELR